VLGEGERLAAAVVCKALALEQAGALERCEQLRDGGRRDGGAAGELGAEDLALTDGLQSEVRGHRLGWLVPGKQPFDPAADQRRRPDERLRCLVAVVSVSWARH
jgi:hypothetical protein